MELQGDRYVYAITVNPKDQTLSICGQSGKVDVPWSKLA
jgi:hypothetical protein